MNCEQRKKFLTDLKGLMEKHKINIIDGTFKYENLNSEIMITFWTDDSEYVEFIDSVEIDDIDKLLKDKPNE